MNQALGGAVLLLSFALLSQRRPRASLAAAQGALLAAAAAWQGWVQSDPTLYGAAVLVLAANGIALPAVLRRVAARLPDRHGAEAMPVFLRLIAGLGVVALAGFAVLPVAAPMREDLALALSVILLGLLLMVTARSAPAQALGFLSLANGLLLAAIGADMPLFSVAVLALCGAVVCAAAVVFPRVRNG